MRFFKILALVVVLMGVTAVVMAQVNGANPSDPPFTMLTHNTAISIDLVIGAFTILLAVGGSLYAIKNLSQRQLDSEDKITILIKTVAEHHANAAIHPAIGALTTVEECERRWKIHQELINSEIKAAVADTMRNVAKDIQDAERRASRSQP